VEFLNCPSLREEEGGLGIMMIISSISGINSGNKNSKTSDTIYK
jgi:hypothetical protein